MSRVDFILLKFSLTDCKLSQNFQLILHLLKKKFAYRFPTITHMHPPLVREMKFDEVNPFAARPDRFGSLSPSVPYSI